MKSTFSIQWLRSIQPRKQRKYRFNAPDHIRGKFMHVHLTKELRKKYNIRSLRIRKGDKVKVLRGSFKGTTGTVDEVSIAREQVFVSGVELTKKEGGNVPYPLHPSNLLLTTPLLDDKKRFKRQKSEEN